MQTALAAKKPPLAIGGLQQAVVLAPADDGRILLRPDAEAAGLQAILAIDGGDALAPGDRVLLASEAGHEAYVIGVIARQASDRGLTARDGSRAALVETPDGEAIQVHDARDRLIFQYCPDRGEGVLSAPRGNLALRAASGDILLEAAGRVRCSAGTEIELDAASRIAAEIGKAAGTAMARRTRLSLGSRSAKLASRSLEVTAQRGLMRIAELRYFGTVFDATLEQARLTAGKIETLAERVMEKAQDVYRQVQGLCQLKAGRVRTLVEDAHYIKADQAYLLAKKDVQIDGEQIRLG